jgi:uncharacterized protein (TIGR03437 family)
VTYARDANANQILKSTDDGATWTVVNPKIISRAVFVDAVHPGTLYSIGQFDIFRSTDDGATFKDIRPIFYMSTFVEDPTTGTIYANNGTSILATTDGFDSVSTVGPAVLSGVNSLALGAGAKPGDPVRLYASTAATSDVFVAKLDANGNLMWSTYLGGSAADNATAIAVDSSGNVFVTGNTSSVDFPVTKGAYATVTPAIGQAASFLTKLTNDGKLVFSTYFSDGKTTPNAIAVAPSGEIVLAGITRGDLPVTQGAYQSSLSPACGFIPCTAVSGTFFFVPPTPASNAFVTKFNAAGSALVFSTYVGDGVVQANGLALDPSGVVFFAGGNMVWELNATGSTLLASTSIPSAAINAVALGPDGNLFLTGYATDTKFATTPGAFQSKTRVFPSVPYGPVSAVPDAFVMKVDPSLSIRYSTLLGGDGFDQASGISVDGAGVATVVGYTTSTNFPLQTPLQTAFAPLTGFITRVSADGSGLLYSTYLGDFRYFEALRVTLDALGNAIFVGNTVINSQFGPPPPGFGHAFVGVVDSSAPPAVSVNAILNAASENGVAIANGETIEVRGQGFGPDAQIVLEGTPLTTVARGDGSVSAVIPTDYARLPGGAGIFQVMSGGQLSNTVLVPVADVSPGLFTADRSGIGQGYILNSDGTLNSPLNPAPVGSVITILATGVGPLNFVGDSAVTARPIAVYIDGFYANGVDARFGPVDGLPGNVYQLRVHVPNPADLVNNNPDLKNFVLPPQVPVYLKVGSASSQQALILSVGGQ